MTEKANPSINRPAEAFKTAGAIAYGGHGSEGFVVDGANPTDIAVQDGGITEADLNAFAETSSTSSFDVTIDGGEAFVFGSWLAIDTDTTVTLASSTASQIVYVGWNKNGGDDVIVGLDSAFSNASGDTDERVPLWTFDTDGSGVTSATDERRIGYVQEATTFTGDVSLDSNTLTGASSITGSNSSVINFQQGGNNDTSIQTQGKEIVLYDTANNVRLLSAQEGGTINVRANIDLLDSDSIQDNGTDAISFDGSQNVEIPNGAMNISSGTLNISAGAAHISLYETDNTTGPERWLIQHNGDELSVGSYDNSDSNFEQILSFNRSGIVDMKSAERLGLPSVSSDPTANAGDMWYRTDLD